jgi:hypothetical protein
MVEFVMTDEEKAMKWSQLDDATLAEFAKAILIQYDAYYSNENETTAMITSSAALHLIRMCVETNAETLTIKSEDVTIEGKKEGDWTVTVKIEKASPSPKVTTPEKDKS